MGKVVFQLASSKNGWCKSNKDKIGSKEPSSLQEIQHNCHLLIRKINFLPERVHKNGYGDHSQTCRENKPQDVLFADSFIFNNLHQSFLVSQEDKPIDNPEDCHSKTGIDQAFVLETLIIFGLFAALERDNMSHVCVIFGITWQQSHSQRQANHYENSQSIYDKILPPIRRATCFKAYLEDKLLHVHIIRQQ